MFIMYTDTASTDPYQILKNWNMSHFGDKLIKEEGWDDVTIWQELTMDELTKQMGFEEGDAKQFRKYVAELNRDPRQLLNRWDLRQYSTALIEEGGHRNISEWRGLTMKQLTNEVGMKDGHAIKFMKYVGKLNAVSIERNSQNLVKESMLDNFASADDSQDDDNLDWKAFSSF